jgi:hypothetical protein
MDFMRRPLSSALVLAAILGAGTILMPSSATAQAVDTLAIRAHSMVLAHDSLEGRGTGTRGEQLAAGYITSQLQRLGIPGGAPDGGYRLPVPLHEIRIDTAATRLMVEWSGAGKADRVSEFRAGEQFIFAPGGAAAFRDFSGSALFAGTAGLAEAALADVGSLEGRVIVLLGSLGNSALTLVPDWVRRGAAGIVLLIPDAERLAALDHAYGPTRLAITTPVDNPVWQPELPVVIAGPEIAAAILADAPLAPDALNGSRPFHALPLEHRISTTIQTEVRSLPTANIAAQISGHDPALRDQFVVYTAHYDHLGIGRPDARGDSIYNGFSDNAAGTAMLLAIAEAIREEPPARSVLFLFLTGEERGLLGSTYYVSAPSIPLDRIAAVINLDAGAPPAPPRNWRIAGGKLSTLGSLATRTATRHGWKAESTPASPNSDHWPFLHAGVPAIFIIPGQDWEGVTRQQKEALQHRWEHYHQPADEWHPEYPLQGLQRYAEVALRIGLAAANSSERPRLLVPTEKGGAATPR